MSTAERPKPRGRPLLGVLRLSSLNSFGIFLVLGVIFTLVSPSHRLIDPDNLTVFLGPRRGVQHRGPRRGPAHDLRRVRPLGGIDPRVLLVLRDEARVCRDQHLRGLRCSRSSSAPAIGFLNGYITVRAGIPSFITTLGTMMFWRGVTIFWSEGLQKPFDTTRTSSSPGCCRTPWAASFPCSFSGSSASPSCSGLRCTGGRSGTGST